MRDKYIRTIETRNEEETKAFGKFLGEHAKAGDTFCLTGDLGSGKTVLTKGIAEGLGLSDEVTSPTFALMNIYQGEVPLYHFDVYRLEDPSMIADIGFYDFVGSDGVSVIEWADLIQDYLPDGYIRLDIKRDFKTGSNRRVITVYQKGESMAHVLHALEEREKEL